MAKLVRRCAWCKKIWDPRSREWITPELFWCRVRAELRTVDASCVLCHQHLDFCDCPVDVMYNRAHRYTDGICVDCFSEVMCGLDKEHRI